MASSNNEYQASNLASILATLASLTPQSQQGQEHMQSAQPLPYSNQSGQPLQQAWQQVQQAPQAGPSPRSTPANGAKVIIDPATIIDWPTGLKCVMRIVAKHENMLQDIRHMIKVQHENEEQWWKGRQALIAKQKERQEKQKRLDEVLTSVGAAASTGTSNADPEEQAKELETFDLKVYRAQMQMVKEFTSKLRGLGVPFFGTKVELVRIAGKDGAGGLEGPKDEKGLIDEAELVKMQKKMLAMLEDLCSD